LKQTQLLDLSGNDKIGDEGLGYLLKSLDQFKGLEMRYCILESVRLISERLMEKLQYYYDIFHVAMLTNFSIVSAIQYFKIE